MSRDISQTGSRDYFDRARSVSAAFMFAAAGAAIIGSFLDWVTIEPPGVVPESQAHRLDAFSGIEATDGWFIVGAALGMLICTSLMVLRRRSGWAWGGFLASIVIGAVAVADYRSIDQIFYDEMQRIGNPAPALGITLVAAAALVGVVASAAGVAASPRR